MNILKATDKDSFAYDKVTLTEEFMNDRAVILGGIFRILSEVLKNYRPNSIPRQGCDIRMSSYYDFGYYICEAWKKGAGIEFCADYITLLNYQLKDFKKTSTSSRLSREINNLKVELETTGIIVEMRKTRNNSRFIQLVIEKSEE